MYVSRNGEIDRPLFEMVIKYIYLVYRRSLLHDTVRILITLLYLQSTWAPFRIFAKYIVATRPGTSIPVTHHAPVPRTVGGNARESSFRFYKFFL